jgi:hypothetical protein
MVAVAGGFGCAAETDSSGDGVGLSEDSFEARAGAGTLEHDSTVATAWMNLIMDRVRAEALNPPIASRVYGYSGVAMYEAVLPGMRDTRRSLVNQLNGLSRLPAPTFNLRRHDWPAAANAALVVVSRHLFEGRSAETLTAINRLYADQLAQRRRAGVRAVDLVISNDFGFAIGRAIVRWASADGFAETRGRAYTPPVGPAFWVPTGGAPPTTLPAEPFWGTLRPFALPNADACAPAAPIAYSEDPESAFFGQGSAVYETNLALTDEQKLIARYWADNAGETPTPPGHWIGIATDLVADGSLGEAAETYALVGIADADAFISCWATKYTYNLLRPETYIRRLIDPAWVPFIPTPQFPEYTSGHSTVSGAAATVLTDIYGAIPFTEVTPVQPGFEPRSFASFMAAAEEAAVSRLYGGIHYPMGNTNGLLQGQCVGGHVNDLQTRRPAG